MKYNPVFFKKAMPEWKKKKDPIIARYIHRPLSFIFSSIFVEMNLTPNQVSFISLILAVPSCFLFASSQVSILLVAYSLLNLWSIIDSADGNMARALGGMPYGDFIDAVSSYFLYGLMFLPLGYSVYKGGGLFFEVGNPGSIIIGALAGSFDTMTRLFFQKMKNNTYEMRKIEIERGDIKKEDIISESNSKIRRVQGKIDSEFACGGTVHLTLLFICIVFEMLDFYIGIYFLYNGMTFLFSFFYLIKKTKCLRKDC